ncbi:MAG: hypothetical protein QOD29_6511, partial [Alphaproteobacteria bacterium]|nr:hypothetical protein [Alphaproteobacteria bacterium]
RAGLLDVLREVAPIAIEARGPTHLDQAIRMPEMLGAVSMDRGNPGA